MGIKWCQLPCQAGSNVLQWWVSECKRVRGQRLQQVKAHALLASNYKVPLTSATVKKKKKKWRKRWDVEENWRVTKGRQNEPETIRWTESDRGVEGDGSEQRKQIQNKWGWKIEDGIGTRMVQFQFPLLILFTFHHNSICESFYFCMNHAQCKVCFYDCNK